ncbi:MAG TPA: VWA domain-containing protein [Ferruginibacter sp.]|nr:VWA domain-containing protein [Ferruginibacter sp.]
MNRLIVLALFLFSLISFRPIKKADETKSSASNSVIQVAILLDVSNSMDGLIDQAKEQLWNLVSILGKADCQGQTPRMEIALYEYGRPTNNILNGYVKQITPFTTDLDLLSQKLFALKTNGGDEYCGEVIHQSVRDLNWVPSNANTYKVIFIAGNESFKQGNYSCELACKEAREKGVVINSIYCGNELQGVKEYWNSLVSCGNGTYSHIDQNLKEQDISTPFDSSLIALNTQLNETYLPFGSRGVDGYAAQASADKQNLSYSKNLGVKRIAAKANGVVYRNSSWDLVDAQTNDSLFVDRLDSLSIPENLRHESRAAIKTYVAGLQVTRTGIQQKIAAVNIQREAYIRTHTAIEKPQGPTLQSELEKIIREQVQAHNMQIH